MGTFRRGRALRARSSAGVRRRLPVAALVLPVLAVQAVTSSSAGASEPSGDEAPLTASVTAAGSVSRSYTWTIEKAADAAVRSTDSTGRASFTYTVSARAAGSTDSGWSLGGTVTVTNPNAWPVTADVTAATTLGGGSSCTVTGGDDVVLAPAGATALSYACSFTSAPAASGSVDATVAWDPAGEATATSTGATAPASFAVTSETNRTVAVVDDQTVPGQRVVLDPSLTWAPGLVRSYTYDVALWGGAPGMCAAYTNTATVDQAAGADPTARATVQACTPEVLPAQAFGTPVGGVHASCRGTVRTRMSNRTAGPVAYTLRIGTRVHRIVVKSLRQKKFVTQGPARARVTLKVGSVRLDRTRIPQRCEAPVVLPDTGLRASSS